MSEPVALRIDITYGGAQYSVGRRTLSALRDEVEAVMATGGWIEVGQGGGSGQRVHLRLAPDSSIALAPVYADE